MMYYFEIVTLLAEVKKETFLRVEKTLKSNYTNITLELNFFCKFEKGIYD